MTETKPEFRTASETAVMNALADPDPHNPVVVEVARLIAALQRKLPAPR